MPAVGRAHDDYTNRYPDLSSHRPISSIAARRCRPCGSAAAALPRESQSQPGHGRGSQPRRHPSPARSARGSARSNGWTAPQPVAHAAAERRPRLLGVQLHDELDPPAVRATLHRRHPGHLRGGSGRGAAVHRAGSGPHGVKNDPVLYGDNPNNKGVVQATGPRDPDKFDAEDDSQREFRQRFIPSGLANEIFLDVYERRASFEAAVTDFKQRLFDAYAAEVARVDSNGDGVVSAAEGDVDASSDGFANNE